MSFLIPPKKLMKGFPLFLNIVTAFFIKSYRANYALTYTPAYDFTHALSSFLSSSHIMLHTLFTLLHSLYTVHVTCGETCECFPTGYLLQLLPILPILHDLGIFTNCNVITSYTSLLWHFLPLTFPLTCTFI